MKNILLFIMLLIVLSCTKISDTHENNYPAVILSKTEVNLIKNWYGERISAIAIDEQGDTLSNVDFSWESSNDTIAYISKHSSNDYITPRFSGVANITAEYNGIVSKPCIVTVAQTDSLYAVVDKDSVTIFHNLSLRQCGCSLDMDLQFTNNTITITEVDTSTAMALCYCPFDFSVTINNLTPGNYTVDIFAESESNPEETSYYYGSVDFTIEDGAIQYSPEITSQYQSDCLN